MGFNSAFKLLSDYFRSSSKTTVSITANSETVPHLPEESWSNFHQKLNQSHYLRVIKTFNRFSKCVKINVFLFNTNPFVRKVYIEVKEKVFGMMCRMTFGGSHCLCPSDRSGLHPPTQTACP